MTDIDLGAPVALTRREALEQAQAHLASVVCFALDEEFQPDKVDCDNIREALRLVSMALSERAPAE